MQSPVDNSQNYVPNHSAPIILEFLKLDALQKEQAPEYSGYLSWFSQALFGAHESKADRVKNKIFVTRSDETKAIGRCAQRLIEQYCPNDKGNHFSVLFDAIIVGTITLCNAVYNKKFSLFETPVAYHRLIQISGVPAQLNATEFLSWPGRNIQEAIEDLIFTAAAGVLLDKTIPIYQQNSIMKRVTEELGQGYFNKYNPLPYLIDDTRATTAAYTVPPETVGNRLQTYTFDALKHIAKEGGTLEECVSVASLTP